jgi:hypothetical protein
MRGTGALVGLAPQTGSGLDARSRDLLRAASFPYQVGPFECFGQRFVIDTSDRDLAAFLADAYAPMRSSDGDAMVIYRVLPPADGQAGFVARDEELIGTHERPARILAYLIWAINRQVIDSSLDRRLMLHAGAVDLGGTAVVLPAPMGSGKTTLVTGLLDRGCGYLSDEAVAISSDHVVESYPKPLSIEPGSWQVLAHHEPAVAPALQPYLERQWQVAPQRISPIVRQSRLSLIVFPRYERGASTRLEAIGPAAALGPAVASTFWHPQQPLPVARVRQLAGAMEAVPAYRLVSGSLEEACDRVLGELGRVTGSRTEEHEPRQRGAP